MFFKERFRSSRKQHGGKKGASVLQDLGMAIQVPSDGMKMLP